MHFVKSHRVFMFLALMTLPSIFYLLIPGFYEPHDLHHIADIYQMYRAISGGQFPPRLGPDFIFGYGYPLFNYYYLLPFYLGAVFYSVFGSLQVSYKLVFILSAFLSVFGMYLFLKEFFGKWSSIIGALLFIYTPYRAVQIYVRGAMGEFLALSLLPLAAWQLVRLVKTPNRKRILATSSIVLALFILSHNFLWALSIPWITLLLLLITNKKDLAQSIFYVFLSGVLALGISSYWWLPALIEQGFVSSITPFPLIDHFPFIRQLIYSPWGYGSSVWGPGDGLSFQVGIVNWLMLIITIVLVSLGKISKSKKVFTVTIWALFGFGVTLFMMNVRSYSLWKIMPFHDFVQFPWRLLLLTTFFTSVMAAVIIDTLKKTHKFFGWIIILGSLVLTISYFRPSKIFYKTDDEYLSRFFANRSSAGNKVGVSTEYLQYSEDYLLLPKWMNNRPLNLPIEKIESSDVLVSKIDEQRQTRWQASVTSNSGGIVTFNSIYFPGWLATVDGKKTDIMIGKPYGQIEIPVNPGEHHVLFYWIETPFRMFADFISVLSLVVIIVLLRTNGKPKD